MEKYRIEEEWAGSRIDRFVRAHTGIPFPELQMLLRKGRITLNGKRTSGGARLETGDVVAMDIIEGPPNGRDARSPWREPVRIPEHIRRFGRIGQTIPVVFEDEYLLVIDKPSGLVVQPGNRKGRGSLLDLLDEYRARRQRPREDFAPFPYTPIHRLDRETSGLIVVAKTRPASRALSAAFSAGAAEKVYLAVTTSTPSPPSGVIEAGIRVEKGTSSRARTGGAGKRAVSEYRTMKRLDGDRALLEVRIETGRTHQVRVHLSSIGAPVLGDRKYGGGRHDRIMLHAWRLRIPHPLSGTELALESPPPTGFGLDG
jgi:RluA family pseudouridine synthase